MGELKCWHCKRDIIYNEKHFVYCKECFDKAIAQAKLEVLEKGITKDEQGRISINLRLLLKEYHKLKGGQNG